MATTDRIEKDGSTWMLRDSSAQEQISGLKSAINHTEDILNIQNLRKTILVGSDLTVESTLTGFHAEKDDLISIIVGGDALTTENPSLYFKYSGEASSTYITSITKDSELRYRLPKTIDAVAFYAGRHGQGTFTIQLSVIKANTIEKIETTTTMAFNLIDYEPHVKVVTANTINEGHDLLFYDVAIPKYTKFNVIVNGSAVSTNSACTLYVVYSDSDDWITLGTLGFNNDVVLVAGKDIVKIGLYATNLTVGEYVNINVCKLNSQGAKDKSGETIAIHQKNLISEPFRCGKYQSGVLLPLLESRNNACVPPFSVKADTYYTFSTSEDAEDDNAAYYIIQLASDYSNISSSAGLNKNNLPYTFKTDPSAAYVGLMAYTSIGNGWAKTIPTWVQFEEGSHATEYENPYALTVDRVGYDSIKNRIERDFCNSSPNLIKEGFVCGSYSSANGFEIKSSGNNSAIPPFAVKAQTPYTLSLPYSFADQNVFYYVFFMNSSMEVIYNSGSIFMNKGIRLLSKTFVSPANAAYAGIMAYTSRSGQNNWEATIPAWIQFEEGEEATPHVSDYVFARDKLANWDVLPSYYDGYMANKAKRINELAKICAADGDVFAFITDQHWPLNVQNSTKLINYLDQHCFIPRLFNGGDTDDHISLEYVRKMGNAFDHKIYYVMGNHEWFGPEGNMMHYYADMFNDDQIGNMYEHYYYVDNVQKKMRYIVLNAFINEGSAVSDIQAIYTSEQRTWLEQEALNIQNGWSTVVFTHSIDNGVAYAAEVKAVLDSAKQGGKDIIAVFCGHTHWDAVNHTNGGIPIIYTTCDKNASWYDEGTNMEPWLERDRPNGSIYEQAFDVVVIDRTNKMIHAVRIGAKAMDNNDIWSTQASGFTDAGTLEERTVSY